MAFEPLLGWRVVRVTPRRTAVDLAEVLRWLVEEVHDDADRVVLVVDDLNTHAPACLYQAFAPARARATANPSSRSCSMTRIDRQGRDRGRAGPPGACERQSLDPSPTLHEILGFLHFFAAAILDICTV
jgi:hypothetical protein